MNQREFYEIGVEEFHQIIGSDLSERLKDAFKEMVGPKDRSSPWEVMSETFSDAAKIFNRKVDLLYSALTSGEVGFICVALDFSDNKAPDSLDFQQLGVALERVYRCVIEDDKEQNGSPRTEDAFLTLKL
jgi:acyl carrier protein